MQKLTKYEGNPILKPIGKSWESLCVLNPACIYDDDGKFKMVYRAAGNDLTHYIHLGLAVSEDGFNFTRCFEHPIMTPDVDNADGGSVEDPRLFKLGGYYYMTYASRPFAPGQYWREDKRHYGFEPEFGPKFLVYNNSLTHLAISKDLVEWKKLGRITDSRVDDRDVVLFPNTVAGKFVRFSRPMEYVGKSYGTPVPSIWISSSDDMMEWEKPVLFAKPQEWWEDAKIGISTPPVECKYGWMVLYHGVASKDKAYRVGAFIVDKNDPTKILARTKNYILEPEYDYETSGYYNGCVFPTGIAIKDDVMYVYYGAADRFICVATAKYSDFIEELYKEGNL